jgi:hypothetical protein
MKYKNLKPEPVGTPIFDIVSLREIIKDKAITLFWGRSTTIYNVYIISALSINLHKPFIHKTCNYICV